MDHATTAITCVNIDVELATGGIKKPPPYKMMKDAQDKFIDPKYLPPGFIVRDGRNLKAAEIQSFFSHVYMRQQETGPPTAFQFRAVMNHAHDFLPTQYPTAMNKKAATAKKRLGARNKKTPPDINAVPAATLMLDWATITTDTTLPHSLIDQFPSTIQDANKVRNDAPTLLQVDQETFANIHGDGWEQETPQTGPGDSAIPHYNVNVNEYKKYSSFKTSGSLEPIDDSWNNIPIDPALLDPPLTPVRPAYTWNINPIDAARLATARYPTPRSGAQTPLTEPRTHESRDVVLHQTEESNVASRNHDLPAILVLPTQTNDSPNVAEPTERPRRELKLTEKGAAFHEAVSVRRKIKHKSNKKI